ncbi:RnfABCDGE type electron transport complex subunit C [Bacteroidaceae bacterium HV4-6-C5C]|nr:RnfABCDGE type electron transport complex subunit C [Bacteroidaceae bacterium HV4-6-C5C]
MNLLIPSTKKENKKRAITSLNPLKRYRLPLKAFGGTLMQPVVVAGDYVRKNQLVAESNSPFYNSIHSPVSGWVSSEPDWDGLYLSIKNDFLELEEDKLYFDPNDLSGEELLLLIKESGIVGCGGAQFPTYAKYLFDGDRQVDYFIVNGTECEPYLTADYALMSEYPEQILGGIACVQKIIKAKHIVITLERQNKELQKNFESSSLFASLPLAIKIVPDNYPQGGELQLIKTVTGIELRKGVLPSSIGIVVNNVATLWEIYKAVYQRQKYIERIVSLSDKEKALGGNYLVKIGTPIEEMLKYLVPEYDDRNIALVVKGGPMMGTIVEPLSASIDKGTGGLMLLPQINQKIENCIGCGYCVEVCPQRLMPLEFIQQTSNSNIPHLSKYNVNDCIECAACEYICPSEIPLISHIRRGKQLISMLKKGKND